MKTKTKQILVAVIALVVVIAGIFGWRAMHADHGEKDITIQIVADDKTIYNGTVDTDAATLAELLKEMEADQEIKLTYTNSAYGMYIQGMGVDEIYSENPAENKYWTYSSENNAQCAKAGFCDAADNLMIADGDAFVFTLAAFE